MNDAGGWKESSTTTPWDKVYILSIQCIYFVRPWLWEHYKRLLMHWCSAIFFNVKINTNCLLWSVYPNCVCRGFLLTLCRQGPTLKSVIKLLLYLEVCVNQNLTKFLYCGDFFLNWSLSTWFHAGEQKPVNWFWSLLKAAKYSTLNSKCLLLGNNIVQATVVQIIEHSCAPVHFHGC